MDSWGEIIVMNINLQFWRHKAARSAAPRYLNVFTWDFGGSCPQHIGGVQDGGGAAALRVKSCQHGGKGGKKEKTNLA